MSISKNIFMIKANIIGASHSKRFVCCLLLFFSLWSSCKVNTPSVVEATSYERIALGRGFGCILGGNGEVYCWGDNEHGQLGIGTLESLSRPGRKVRNLNGKAKAISVGDFHTCALLEPIPLSPRKFTVKCWGDNREGQLGYGDLLAEAGLSAPKEDLDVPNLDGVFGIALGANHSCALLGTTEGARVRCWGANDKGQLGLGGDGHSIRKQDRPADDVSLPVAPISQLVANGGHNCILSAEGDKLTAYCWGDNRGSGSTAFNGGQVGLGSNAASSVHTPGKPINLEDVRTLALGVQHSCALLFGGRVRCWGSNGLQQLGVAHAPRRTAPPSDNNERDSHLRFTGVAEKIVPIRLAAGGQHTCALFTENQHVRCWGGNSDGQLGYGNKTGVRDEGDVTTLGKDVEFPVEKEQIKALAAGYRRSCVITSNSKNKLLCWGYSYGCSPGETTCR